jgi:nitrogen-specific signal transduction histidine kinase
MLCRWTLLRDEKGQPKSVLVINSDITEHKLLESEFLRAQRLEGIGALASGIAHDLNNILAPMIMMPSFLEKKINDPDGKKILKTIETCARRGSDIIKQLLTFARGASGTHVPFVIRHLVHDMKKIIQETFPREISSNIAVPNDLWPVMGDATQIHQVLMNLCVNARDAMPNGGTLTLKAANVILDESFVAKTPNAKSGPHVCLVVTDTGTGIQPENLERIFDPFFTTKEVGKGTGLGLSTVLGIVRGHGGFVQVETELGLGTSFKLYFPATPKAETTTVTETIAFLPSGHGELILVVDDEVVVRQVVTHALENYGYRVISATQGKEGLDLFARHQNEIKAVITDMMMPVMNGPAMIKELRAIDPCLRIIGITGLPEQSSIEGLDTLDLSTLLVKPFTGEKLLRTLNEVLMRASQVKR